jgi:hypothetical protein
MSEEEQRVKGPGTAVFERLEKRDERQDARTDTAWQAAVDAAKSSTRMLYVLLALSMAANAALTAMVLGRYLSITKDGVTVGSGKETPAAPVDGE